MFLLELLHQVEERSTVEIDPIPAKRGRDSQKAKWIELREKRKRERGVELREADRIYGI